MALNNRESAIIQDTGDPGMYRYDRFIPRSYQRFITGIGEELKKGNNVILRIPAPNLNDNFLRSLQRIIREHAGPELEILDAGRKTDYKSLLSFLNDELSLRNKTDRKKNIQAHFKSESGTFSALILHGLDSWSEASQKQVSVELSHIVSFTRNEGRNRGRLEGRRFLALVSPLFNLPPDSEGLSILNWWGVTTPADHEFLFEEYINDRRESMPQAMYWWLKAISHSVGGDDPQLIEAIVERAPRTLDEVGEILLQHNPSKSRLGQSDYHRHFLFRKLSPDPGRAPSQKSDRRLWSLGLLAPNRYSLYHPVMLTLDPAILEKTIAMGQREVFFPLIDQVHAFITYVVEEKIGSLEHLFQDDPESDKKYEKILSEISFLHYSLQNLVKGSVQEFPETQSLCALSKLWTNIRNLSAHVRMLPYEYLEKAISHYESLYQSMIR
jgi:hypothetical protein